MFKRYKKMPQPKKQHIESIKRTLQIFWIDFLKISQLTTELPSVKDKVIADKTNEYAEKFLSRYRTEFHKISRNLWPESKELSDQIMLGLTTFELWLENCNNIITHIDSEDTTTQRFSETYNNLIKTGRELSNDMNEQIYAPYRQLIHALGISDSEFQAWLMRRSS